MGLQERVLITGEQLDRRADEMAAWIDKEYEGKNVLLVPVFMGALPITAKLMERIKVPDMELDGVRVKTYKGQESSEPPKLVWDLVTNIEGRHVLVIDDIADTRTTMKFVKEELLKRNPASLRVLTMLDKPDRQVADVEIDQVGFVINNVWVEHVGLDTEGKNRNGRDITYRVSSD